MISLSRKSKIISLAAISLLLISLIPSPGIAKETTTDGASDENIFPEEGINTWIPTGDFATSSLVKVPRFPDEILGDADERNLQLASVRNEQVSAQLAVASTQKINNLSTSISEITNESGAAISSENIDIRYVGYVPVKEKREVVGGALIED